MSRIGDCTSTVATALCAAILCASAGCASSPPSWTSVEGPSGAAADLGLWRRPPPTPEAADAYAEAKRLCGLGRTAEAVAKALAASDADPGFLEAHRLLQDLAARTTADWWLRERYERRLRERPDDADSWYLLARIEPDAKRQIDLFSEALARDPRHPYATLGRAVALARRGEPVAALGETRRAADLAPWLALPWLWLGGESFKHGETATAERFFEAARDRAVDDPRAWLGVAESADGLGRRAAASAAALRALRLAPGDESLAAAATEILVRSGVASDLEPALEALASAQISGAPVGPCCAARGRLLLAVGRAEEADAAFDEAVLHGILPTEIAAPRRLARVAAGRDRQAVEGALDAVPPETFADDNLYAPRWRRLRAAAATDATSPRALLELAEAMTSVGWLEEARAVLERARRSAPRDPVIAARAASESAFAAFVGDLARIARETRESGRGGAGGPGVRDVLARMSDASRARLGRDAARGAVVRGYPLLGEFAASAASSGEFETTFGEHGLMCLVGARAGSAAELVIGRLVVVRAGETDHVLGASVACDECWIESDGLPADAAGLRRGLAGLTLDRLVILELDAVRRPPRAVDVGLPSPQRPAATREERRSLDTPSDVAGRIERELAGQGRLGAGALDAVRRHELVHVYDAARLLPVSEHPFNALAFGLAHGFSGASIERALEGRAQALSILSAREPRLALAALFAFLPSADGETPHVAGYRDAAQTAVDLVIDDPASFPSIAPDVNVLQQMDRLTDAEVRELARRLAKTL